MSALGRISGPLLKSNLIRNGIDLAFETDLLYLDVNNQKIGVKLGLDGNGDAIKPEYELDVGATTRTTDLIVTNRADIGNVNIVGNTISSDTAVLNLGTLDNIVYNNKLRVDSIDIEGNVISTNDSNANLELRPHGTGTVEIFADTNVTGNIHATGNITADGSITIGDANTDNVIFNAEVASDIIPDADDTYNLGSGGRQYSISSGHISLGDVTLTVSSGIGTLSIPSTDSTAWIDDLMEQPLNYKYLMALEGTEGTLHDVTRTGAWSGEHPQTANISAPSILDGTYNVVQINIDAKRWADVWVDNIVTNGVNTGTLIVDGVDLTLRQGNTWYVAENGDDLNSGTHQQDPKGSLKNALSYAQSGDTVVVYPGVYTEEFPLTVPTGVTLKGLGGIRSVKIIPTTLTRYNDAFLLNGETTIEDLTVADFYSGGNLYAPDSQTVVSAPFDQSATFDIGTAPFAHTYVSGGRIHPGGPTNTGYNITNATYNHTTGILEVFWSGPAIGSVIPGQKPVFLTGLTFSCNGGNRTFPDNGYAFRFATDFEVTTRSPYIKNITVITAGSTTTVEDPRGYNAHNAGKGAYIDGAYATTNSKEASMLFHSATFITPGVDAVTMTNGVRVEWLNSFTYFANRSIYAFDSNDGLYGAGKTRIRLSGISGTFQAGDTVTFDVEDSTDVSITIDDVDGDTLIVDGKDISLIGFDSTPTSISNGSGATATTIENVDVRDFGAEVRLIGSASVYGDAGLVGVGAGVLMYAIGHNLAYIGNGKEVTNDAETVIQSNEVIEIDNAKIRYNSVDHKGDFRVGDLFYVNQETGSATFTVSDFIINTTNGVTFTTGSDTTFVDGTKVETGNWRFSGNTIETVSGSANFNAANGEINLQDNTNITGNLDVTGNVTIGGNITIGDEATDTIQIIAGIDSDIVPKTDSTYSLGTLTKTWSNLFVDQINVDNIQITQNYITTTESNSDLELRANGTGKILVPNNDVQIDNNLNVIGTTTLANTTITGTVTTVGDTNQTGNINVTGNVIVEQEVNVTGKAQFEEILIDDNYITTTSSNADLELRANGTGEILVPNNNVNITNDLTVTGDVSANNVTVTANVTANDANIGDVQISGTTVEATASNADLELRANGTGDILVPSNDVILSQNLTVNGSTTLQGTNINGNITHVGDTTQTGNVTLLGEWTNGNIKIEDNFVTTTNSNSDLELRANGTGQILLPDNDLQIDNNLTVSGATDLQTTTITGTITHTGNTIQTGDYTIAGSWSNGDLQFDGNVISTTTSNSDLELRANGVGEILIPNNNVQIDNDLTVSGATDLQGTTVTGTITHTGDTTQTGNYTIAGSVTNGDIQIDGNTIETTASNSDLELRASGSGTINVPLNNVTFSQALTVSGATDLQNTTVTGIINHTGDYNQTGNFTIGGEITNGNILIEDNFIATTESNSDLELRANGTGEILIPNNDVRIANNLYVLGDATLGDTTLTGNVSITGDITQSGDYSISDDVTVGGALTVTRSAQFEEILIDDNFITTTTSNADLELRANGTGEILIPNNDLHITNDLTVDGTITVGDINSAGTITANRFSTGDILIDDNFITTTTSNSNLELRANGTGEILIPNNDLQIDNDLTVSGTTTLTNTTITGTITHVGNTNQTGNTTVTGDVTVTQDLDVSGAAQFEEILVDDNYITTTTSNADLELRANGAGNILIPNNNVEITNDLTVSGTLTTNNIVATGTISASGFRTDSLLIDDNYITTTNSNADLELRASGTGSIFLNTLEVNETTISSATDDITFVPGSGLVKIDSTGSLVLPVGDTSQRPTGSAGQIRFNSELDRYEGFDGTAWSNLKGVEDLDGDTKVTAELTPGANDNTIRFYTAGTIVTDINSDRLSTNKIVVDDITIDGNVISTSTLNTDLEFTANGTGAVVIDNFSIANNTITNTVSNSITVFEETDNGYVKFDGTYGFVIPVGGNAQRPPIAYTETGQMRYNTDGSRVEIYDGSNWVSAAGSSAGISRADAEDIAFEIVLSLG